MLKAWPRRGAAGSPMVGGLLSAAWHMTDEALHCFTGSPMLRNRKLPYSTQSSLSVVHTAAAAVGVTNTGTHRMLFCN